MPTKTVGTIVLKFLSGTNLTLKVDRFDGFVNWSSIADFMITKTSRCTMVVLRNGGAYFLHSQFVDSIYVVRTWLWCNF